MTPIAFTVTLAAALAAVVLLVVHLASAFLAARRLMRPAPLPPLPQPAPPVALLRPVCGLDAFDRETLESSFHVEWPEMDLVFCAAQESDPAVPALRAMIAAHPQVRARLLIGDDRETGNPKLDNLLKGWRATRAEHVVMADANLLLPPDYLRRVMAAWDGAGVGMVASPAVGTRDEGFGGALEAAFLNGNQARWQLAVDSLGHGFAQGKTLAFRRSVLEAAGGFAALARAQAEDAAATKAIRGLGLRVRLVDRPFAQPVGRRSFRQVWRRQARWARLRRDAFPVLYAGEVLNGPLLPLLLAGVAGQGLGAGWAMSGAAALVWYGAEAALARAAGWPVTPLHLAAWLLRDALLPGLWLTGWHRAAIEWRGNTVSAGTPRPLAG